MCWRRIGFALLFMTVIGTGSIGRSAYAAESPFDGPVTALAITGDRLLIGQGVRLIDARISAGTLQVIATRDLNIGAIRSIVMHADGSALALGETALTAFDSTDTVTDVQPFGGQQMITSGDQVFVAALEAGVRRFQWQAGKLTAQVGIATGAPAESIALGGTDRLWIAEGRGGLWEYNLSGVMPTVIFGDKQMIPATLVRTADPDVIVGYGTQLAVLTTQGVKIPRLIARFALGEAAIAADALRLDSGDLLIGRVAADGADVILLPLKNLPTNAVSPTVLQPIMQFGSGGGGEHLAQAGHDLFYGSQRGGLAQLAIDSGHFTTVAAWGMGVAAACAPADYAPVAPSPVANGVIAPNTDGSITLSWRALCPAEHYLVQIDDQPAVTIDQPPYRYQPPVGTGAVTWQVTAQIGTANDAQIAAGPRWRAEIGAAGLLSLPVDPDQHALLYHAPLTLGPGLVPQTPMGTLLIVGLLAIGGLIVIAGGAWLIGQLSSSRRSSH